MRCDKCGIENKNEAVFCKNCGQRLVGEERARSHNNRAMIASISLALLAAVAVAILLISNNAKEQGVDSYTASTEGQKLGQELESDNHVIAEDADNEKMVNQPDEKIEDTYALENVDDVATTEGEGIYTLRYSLSNLKKEGGNGNIGEGVYVPDTLAEYYDYYGVNQRIIEPEGYYPGGLGRRYAPIPETNLLIEYEDFGETDHNKIEAWGITGPLGDLVRGLEHGEQLTLRELANKLRSLKGNLDAEGMLPDPIARRLEKSGLAYVQEQGQYSYIYYADGSQYAYAMRLGVGIDDLVDTETEVSISTNAAIYQ